MVRERIVTRREREIVACGPPTDEDEAARPEVQIQRGRERGRGGERGKRETHSCLRL